MRALLARHYRRLLSMRTRNRIARRRLRLRQLMPIPRVLPDFLIIGAMRGGTSSLYQYLGRHPQCIPALRKETHYFSRHPDRGLDWYRSHFPTRPGRAWRAWRTTGRVLTFEASPGYLCHPEVPARVARVLPRARFVVLLRDPVDRAVSHYQHMRRLGFETRPLATALTEEPERREAAAAARRAGGPVASEHRRARWGYVELGRYGRQLRRWLQHVDDERLLVLESAALFDEPAAVVAGICAFLDIRAPDPDLGYPNHTPSPAADRAERDRLVAEAGPRIRAALREDSERLVDLLGWRPSWLRRAPEPARGARRGAGSGGRGGRD